MSRTSSVGPIVTALALTLFANPANAQSDLFRATAEGNYVSSGGNFFTFTLAGTGDPEGDFTGDGDYTLGSGGEIQNGEGTLHTDNGDIYFTFEAQLNGDGTFAGTFTIAGGTDLYENATGGAQLIGQINEDDDSFMIDLKGVINY